MSGQKLQLIPVYEDYIEYMIKLIMLLPRTEKYSIGTEYKQSMYSTLEEILYIPKTEEKKRLYYLNKIDSKLDVQRIMLRIMYKSRWIDSHKFEVAMDKIYEIGKILGGLIKYYVKNNQKPI